MLCPEVWDFDSALKNTHIHRKSGNEILEHCEDVISNHHLNHHVSVLISDCESIPEDLSNILKTDCEYYRVHLPLASLIDKEFIDLFILAGGEVSALSIGTRLDADDCSAALLPSGHFVLSVGGDRFRSLGIEGVATSPDRYAVRRCGLGFG